MGRAGARVEVLDQERFLPDGIQRLAHDLRPHLNPGTSVFLSEMHFRVFEVGTAQTTTQN